jgi:flagellar assembly factor FliW
MPAERLTIETTRFGTVEVEADRVIHFPKGLLGFEHRRQFTIIENEDHKPFAHLQSVEDPSLTFIIVNPRMFFPNYKVQVERPEIAELSVTDLSRVNTWVIVTVPDEIAAMSANLQGPLLINSDKNIGKQVVLMRSPYTTRHYLLDELTKIKTKPEVEVPVGAPA